MDKNKSKKYKFNLPLRIKEVFLKKNPKEKSNKEEQCKSINNNERRKFLEQIKDQNGSAIQVAKKIQMLSDIENNENKTEVSLIEYKKQNFIQKIILKIKSLFRRKN